MKAIWTGICLGALVLLLLPGLATAEAQKAYNIRMHRSDMPDTTDVQSILNSIITGGMTNEQKMKAIWRVVFQYSHQDNPPQECIAGDTHDIVKMFNVYGYRMCCCASTCIETLATAAGITSPGFEPQTRGLTGHNVPEVYYNGAWHMFDSSLINYFKKIDGSVASVDEIHADIAGLINVEHCPFANPLDEKYPAGTHGLPGARIEYSSVVGECADGYANGWQVGHRNVLTLREGETLVRDCSVPAAHHVNEDGIGAAPYSIDDRAGSGPEFQFMNQTIPDQGGTYYYVHPLYHGGIIGNGTLTYDPSLADGGYRGGIESETNIACSIDDSQGPAVHLAATGTGTIIIRMQCPYIFLGGTVNATFKRAAGGDSVKVYISTNNMLDWTQIYNVTSTGNSIVASIDTKVNIYRRYSYYLKFEFISGTSATNVGVESLTISNIIQHAQRAMPFLVQGTNSIVVDADSTPVQTMTVAPRIIPLATSYTLNESLASMHAVVTSAMVVSDGYMSAEDWANRDAAMITFPITAPGDIVAIRAGGAYKLSGAADTITVQYSTTGPDTGFVNMRSVAGVDVKKCDYFAYTSIPAGTRQVWVRFATHLANVCCIKGHLRIDVDYTEAGATVRPFKVKHEWTEGGNPMSHTETITSVPHTYSINCAAEPTMTAVTTWVEHTVIDTEAPTVVVSKAVLYGTASDDKNRPAEVVAGGTAYTVNQSNGSWQTTDTTFSDAVAIPITAADASGNTRTVNLTIDY